MSKPTMTAVKKALHGKRVNRTIEGLATTDDLAAMRKEILEIMALNNIPAEQLMENDQKFYIKDGVNYWLKPKLTKNATGVIEFTSRDYVFTNDVPHPVHGKQPSYGPVKGLEPLEGNKGFAMVIEGKGRIIYQLAE